MRIWKKLRKYFYINRGQRIANQEALSTMSYFDKTSVGSVTKLLFPQLYLHKLVPKSHCINQHCFRVSLHAWQSKPIFDIVMFPYDFGISFSVSKRPDGIFIESSLSLQTTLVRADLFAYCKLLIHEYCIWIR